MAETPLITDSHCHLDFPDFAGELPQIVARARAAGVHRMVTICTRLKNEPAVRAIAEAHEGVFYAAGAFGSDRGDIEATLLAFLANPEATAKAYGKLTSNCSFCGKELSDERSIRAGWGPTCAENFGLPWGD